jgi:hypothetical protein
MEVLQSWAAKNGAEWSHLQSKGRSMHAAKELASEDMLMNIPFRMLVSRFLTNCGTTSVHWSCLNAFRKVSLRQPL